MKCVVAKGKKFAKGGFTYTEKSTLPHLGPEEHKRLVELGVLVELSPPEADAQESPAESTQPTEAQGAAEAAEPKVEAPAIQAPADKPASPEQGNRHFKGVKRKAS